MNSLLINEPPLQVLPSLAVAIGVNEAIVLQQVHYWLKYAKKTYAGKKWIYKSFKKWHEQDFSFWSERTIQRIFKSLISKGLVLAEKLADNKQNRVNYYTIDYKKLSEISKKVDNKNSTYITDIDNDKMSQSNTTDCKKESRQTDMLDKDTSSSSLTTYCHDVKENKQEINKETIEESNALVSKHQHNPEEIRLFIANAEAKKE